MSIYEEDELTYEPTEEEEKATEEFYGDYSDFIPVPGAESFDDEDIYKFIWDNFQQARTFALLNPDMHIYTVVDEENTAWILKDWHYVNRMSYFFTRNPRPIPDVGCPY